MKVYEHVFLKLNIYAALQRIWLTYMQHNTQFTHLVLLLCFFLYAAISKRKAKSTYRELKLITYSFLTPHAYKFMCIYECITV